ncbi:MAG: DUF4423 domain-containing protein [Myxococcales bacterium]|nr:DUF4423 domain-containing protein [Myxococcales bacterium]
MDAPLDYETLARDLTRALRGDRSQTAFARRLGYRSNVVYTWESGRSFPTAARFLEAAMRTGIDVRAALSRFYGAAPEWLNGIELDSAEGVARLLSDLRGRTPIVHLAKASGLSRFAVARMLQATTEPRLPDFLRLFEATSLRLLDFVALLVDPERLPSVARTWRDLEATRQAAYDEPWTLGVLRALELEDYARLPAHRPGWIAHRIGISEAQEGRCLGLLERSRQIRMVDGRWQLSRVLTVDTRRDSGMARALRAWWTRVALERLEHGADGIFAYNLAGVSARDYDRLSDLHRAHFRQLRAIVSQSEPVERVVLFNSHLLGLDGRCEPS